MMSRSISQTTAAISQITTEITTTVMIKLNAPRTLLTSSQLKGRDTPAKDTPTHVSFLTRTVNYRIPGVLRITNMMKTMRINHKMPTMKRITSSDLLVSHILNCMIPCASPHIKGLG
jgi:hypothetical protein